MKTRLIPSDQNGSLMADLLATAIKEDKANGLIPCYVSFYMLEHAIC